MRRSAQPTPSAGMRRSLLVAAMCLMPAILSGCASALEAKLGVGGTVSQIPGAAAGLFGIPAATIAQQFSQEVAGIQSVVAQLQMLKAQLDGNLPILPTPIIAPDPPPVVGTPIMAPVPAPEMPPPRPAPMPSPRPGPVMPPPSSGSPIVTPTP